ncbi:MAG: hypothetical protein RIS47_1065 [Bacteroidota bacterium]
MININVLTETHTNFAKIVQQKYKIETNQAKVVCIFVANKSEKNRLACVLIYKFPFVGTLIL